MKLVEYSDSEEEADALPSLPANFLDLYSSTVRTSTRDDPALHGGRKRLIPHVEGNWSAHVYLEWLPSDAQRTTLENLVNKLNGSHSLLSNELGVAQPLHVSLSRPLVLRTEQKDDFQERLKAKLEASRVAGFTCSPSMLEQHPNDDGSRFFHVLRLSIAAKKPLGRLLATCNEIAGEYGLPMLYEKQVAQHAFHISIAWSLASQETVLMLPRAVTDMEIEFSSVKIRIGQAVTTVALK